MRQAMSNSTKNMIRFENGSVLITNDPVITYDHITDGKRDGNQKHHKGHSKHPVSPILTLLETLLMLAFFALCTWMGFHN